MKAKVYDNKGKEKSEVSLPKEVFGLPWKSDLVHQVVVGMQSNKRAGNAHTKDRSEVRGGGKKPWRQKGTGRARHGSSRSPIWVGGGVTFGPRNERNYDKKINKRMKKKALNTILSQKLRDGEIIFVDGFNFTEPKTRQAKETLTALSKVKGLEKIAYKTGKRAAIYNPEKNDAFIKSFRNIESAGTDELRNINPLDVISYKYVVFVNPKEAIAELSK
jgi:large subunit ribosomal protein L4